MRCTYSFDGFLQRFVMGRFGAAGGLGFLGRFRSVELLLLSLSWRRDLLFVLLLSDLLQTLKYRLGHLYRR